MQNASHIPTSVGVRREREERHIHYERAKKNDVLRNLTLSSISICEIERRTIGL